MKPLSGSGIHNWLGSLLLVVVLGAVVWVPGCANRWPVASRPATASRLVTEGLERARQGDYRGATERYDRAIRADPANAEAYAHRGFARMALGDAPGGEADLRQAVHLRIAGWTAAIARKPDDVQTLLRRGVAHADLGEYRAAIEDYDHVLRLQSANAEAYYLRGNARYRLGDQAGAITDYDAALRLNPDLLPAYLARAGAHAALGKHAAAAADYEAARRITRDDQVR